jgi:RNA polymerase sigma-70 factor (ECF subfamily)
MRWRWRSSPEVAGTASRAAWRLPMSLSPFRRHDVVRCRFDAGSFDYLEGEGDLFRPGDSIRLDRVAKDQMMGTTLKDAAAMAPAHDLSRPPADTPAPLTGNSDPTERADRRARFEREALVHLDALYSFARKLSRNTHDAEDLVSEAILRAFDRWEQYELGTNVRAWLFTILYHAFVSRKRRIESHEVAWPEDEDGRSTFEVVGESDPEGTFYDSFLDEEITRAIDALPEEYRSAVVLSDVHGLRYGEIAQILGVPEGTIKSRLFRGRRMLQGKLVRYAVDMGYLADERRPAMGARQTLFAR